MSKINEISADSAITTSATNIKALPGAFKMSSITALKLSDLTTEAFSKTNKTFWTRG